MIVVKTGEMKTGETLPKKKFIKRKTLWLVLR
jgi:hypothetical protein